jgi:hypothetical protein
MPEVLDCTVIYASLAAIFLEASTTMLAATGSLGLCINRGTFMFTVYPRAVLEENDTLE